MSNDITAQVEALCKKVNDLVELNQKKADRPEGEKLEIEEKVKKLVGEALAAHPGAAIKRKTEFEATPSTKTEEILSKMPKELQIKADDCLIASKVLRRPVQHLKSWERFTSEAGDFKKALDTATSGGGSEWIPTGFSNDFYHLVRVNGALNSNFRTITMPTNPYKVPVQIGALVTTKHAEQTADTGQTKISVADSVNITSALTFTAVGHGAKVLVSKEMEEDSIIPVLPMLRNEIVRALVEGREDAVINGDTTGTHQDSDVASAGADHRAKMFKGLRKYAIASSYKTDISTLTTTALRTLRRNMGKFGVYPDNMMLVLSPSAYVQVLDLTEVRTVQNLGNMASLITGQLASFDGIPIVVSDLLRQDMNASGVYDGVTTTKTGAIMVNRNVWAIGERRNATVNLYSELYAESDQDALIVKERIDFEPVYPSASNKSVWYGYNLTA